MEGDDRDETMPVAIAVATRRVMRGLFARSKMEVTGGPHLEPPAVADEVRAHIGRMFGGPVREAPPGGSEVHEEHPEGEQRQGNDDRGDRHVSPANRQA